MDRTGSLTTAQTSDDNGGEGTGIVAKAAADVLEPNNPMGVGDRRLDFVVRRVCFFLCADKEITLCSITRRTIGRVDKCKETMT